MLLLSCCVNAKLDAKVSKHYIDCVTSIFISRHRYDVHAIFLEYTMKLLCLDIASHIAVDQYVDKYGTVSEVVVERALPCSEVCPDYLQFIK